ncbi:MAG: Mrp/NBP35 family ATP-binding protein [Acidimicrobiales bacterium]
MNLVAAVNDRLTHVYDPELGVSVVELGMVRAVEVDDQDVVVTVALTTTGCPLRTQIERDIREAVASLDGVRGVRLVIEVMSNEEKRTAMTAARKAAQRRAPTTSLAPTTPVLAIASGKGGVGKSSVTANLATALALTGLSVGVLDADVWGFSLARLLDIDGEVQAVAGKMQPLVRAVGAGEIRLLSMGLLADEDQALLWRGLIVQKAVAQFIEDADWSGVDYLLIDTPPGTGDIAMTLARLLPAMGQLIVTTPNRAAQRIAARAADFARKSNIRVLGVIENMSAFTCACGERHAIFGDGGGAELAEQLHVPLLASIPLHGDVAHGGDAGRPVVSGEDGEGVFSELASRILRDVAPPAGALGCSVRLLDAIARAVEPV